jgi:hypothetical protein
MMHEIRHAKIRVLCDIFSHFLDDVHPANRCIIPVAETGATDTGTGTGIVQLVAQARSLLSIQQTSPLPTTQHQKDL